MDDGCPAAAALFDHARHVAIAVAAEGVRVVADREASARRWPAAWRRRPRHTRVRWSGCPAELEAERITDDVQRQLLPLQGRGRSGVERHVRLEDERRAEARRERRGPYGAEVRGLGLSWQSKRSGALSLRQLRPSWRPQTVTRVDACRVRPEDPERVAVVVALLDELGLGHRRAGRHVELGDAWVDRQVLERVERIVEAVDRRGQATRGTGGPTPSTGTPRLEQALDEAVQRWRLPACSVL